MLRTINGYVCRRASIHELLWEMGFEPTMTGHGLL